MRDICSDKTIPTLNIPEERTYGKFGFVTIFKTQNDDALHLRDSRYCKILSIKYLQL